MNMTGDPNKRNKPTMFSFGYPTSQDFPRFNDQSLSVNSLFSNPSGSVPVPNFFPSNNFPFKNENTFFTPPECNIPNYSIPSTSTSNGFPFCSQIPVSVNCTGNLPTSFTHLTPNVTFGGHFNKTAEIKSNISFASTSNNVRNYAAPPLIGVFGCKRKTESPSTVPLKQHITEERMAEHMSRLHISSQTPTSSTETLPTRERRLYMCEEMQRLQTESIIPAQILDKVYRPCTALVPWRPPVVPSITKENNNNEEEPDNNRMDNMDMDS